MKAQKDLILRLALIVVGALVVLALGYVVLIRPEGAKLKRIKASEADARQALAAYNTKVAAARSAWLRRAFAPPTGVGRRPSSRSSCARLQSSAELIIIKYE